MKKLFSLGCLVAQISCVNAAEGLKQTADNMEQTQGSVPSRALNVSPVEESTTTSQYTEEEYQKLNDALQMFGVTYQLELLSVNDVSQPNNK